MNDGLPAVPEGRMARAIREALGAFAAPDVRDQILARALYVAGLEAVPEGGPMLREFVDRFLRQAMEATLDGHSAEMAVLGLDPIVRLAETHQQTSSSQPGAARPSSMNPWDSPIDLPPSVGDDADWQPLDPNTAKTPLAGIVGDEPPTRELPSVADPAMDLPLPEDTARPGEGEGRPSANWDVVIDDELEEIVTGTSAMPAEAADSLVITAPRPAAQHSILFASRDPLVLQQFDESIGGQAVVLQAADPLTLLDMVQGPEPRPQVLVFDCESPSIQPATLAALAADFPEGAAVLLWRPTPDLARELLSRHDGHGWRACSSEWTVEEVALESLALAAVHG